MNRAHAERFPSDVYFAIAEVRDESPLALSQPSRQRWPLDFLC
jgi:hypothetical protein